MTDNFLSRWSRRKIDARKGEQERDAPKPPDVAAVPPGPVIPVETGIQPEARAPLELPPIDSLTIDSDFTPFMQPGVDPAMKREALRKLVRDPRFNVMDGLDVYIDDYSKPDPLPAEWLSKLNQVKRLGIFVEASESQPDALQNPVEEQPVEAQQPADSSDAANRRSQDGSVTDGGTSGGTLPRNEA